MLASGATLPFTLAPDNAVDAMDDADKAEECSSHSTQLLRRRASLALCGPWLPASPAQTSCTAEGADCAADDEDGAGGGQLSTLTAMALLNGGIAGGAAALAVLAMTDNEASTIVEGTGAALRWASSTPPGAAAERAWCKVLAKALVLRATARAPTCNACSATRSTKWRSCA